MDKKIDLERILKKAEKNFKIFIDTGSIKNIRIAEKLVDKVDSINDSFLNDKDAVHHLKAEVYLFVNRLDDALRCITHAIKINPEADHHYATKSEICTDMNKYFSAINNITIAINLNPTNGRYYTQRGEILLNKSTDHLKALKDFNTAEKLYSEDPQINPRFKVINASVKSFVLVSLQRYEEVIEVVDKYTKITGDYTIKYIGDDREIYHSILLNNKGFSLLALGRIDDAIICLKEGIKFNDNLENLHSLIGDAYRLNGNINKAKDSYAKTLELFVRNEKENYWPAIRAERGLAKLGIIINRSIEKEAIDNQTFTPEKLDSLYQF